MKDLIKTKKHAFILSHQGPDGDSVGSSVSLSLYLTKIGIDNKIIFPDHYPSFFLGCLVLKIQLLHLKI